jgi:hypothetical protein
MGKMVVGVEGRENGVGAPRQEVAPRIAAAMATENFILILFGNGLSRSDSSCIKESEGRLGNIFK